MRTHQSLSLNFVQPPQLAPEPVPQNSNLPVEFSPTQPNILPVQLTQRPIPNLPQQLLVEPPLNPRKDRPQLSDGHSPCHHQHCNKTFDTRTAFGWTAFLKHEQFDEHLKCTNSCITCFLWNTPCLVSLGIIKEKRVTKADYEDYITKKLPEIRKLFHAFHKVVDAEYEAAASDRGYQFDMDDPFPSTADPPSSNTGKQKESKAPNPPPPVSRNKEPSKPPKPSKQGTTESPVKPTLASKPTNNGPQLLSPTKRKPSTVRAEAMPKQKVLFAPPSLPKSLPFAKEPFPTSSDNTFEWTSQTDQDPQYQESQPKKCASAPTRPAARPLEGRVPEAGTQKTVSSPPFRLPPKEHRTTHGNFKIHLQYPNITDLQLHTAYLNQDRVWNDKEPFQKVDSFPIGRVWPSIRLLMEVYKRCKPKHCNLLSPDFLHKIMNHFCCQWKHPLLKYPGVLFRHAQELHSRWKAAKKNIFVDSFEPLPFPDIPPKELFLRLFPPSLQGQRLRMLQALEKFGGTIEQLIRLLYESVYKEDLLAAFALMGKNLDVQSQRTIELWYQVFEEANITFSQRQIIRKVVDLPSEAELSKEKERVQSIAPLRVYSTTFPTTIKGKLKIVYYAKFGLFQRIQRGILKRISSGLIPSNIKAIILKWSGDGYHRWRSTGQLQLSLQYINVKRAQSMHAHDTLLISTGAETPEIIARFFQDLLQEVAAIQSPDGTFFVDALENPPPQLWKLTLRFHIHKKTGFLQPTFRPSTEKLLGEQWD